MTRRRPAAATRREFLKTLAAGMCTAGGLAAAFSAEAAENEAFSFGLVTDVHYGDTPPRGTRHYRDSVAKLREAVDTFNRQEVAFVVELGDFIDAGPTKQHDLDHLCTVDEVFRRASAPRHYVLGNHCLHALAKEDFLAHCDARTKRSFYSFDEDRFHFVVLDANFRRDGSAYAAGNFQWTDAWIHPPQQAWLAADLARAAGRPTFVFVHQNLDDETDPHGVKNAPEIRRILESAGNVAAVFQGHKHSGGHAEIGGIPYCTLKAMVEGPAPENNAYGIVRIDRAGHSALEGFGRQGGMALCGALSAD